MIASARYWGGDRFLSSAGAGGNCARPMRLPDPSPVLDKNRAPMGPEILSSTGAGVWRKAPMAFADSSSVLDKFQSERYWGGGQAGFCFDPPESLLSRKEEKITRALMVTKQAGTQLSSKLVADIPPLL